MPSMSMMILMALDFSNHRLTLCNVVILMQLQVSGSSSFEIWHLKLFTEYSLYMCQRVPLIYNPVTK